MTEHFCRNCGRYDAKAYCEYDNIERILKQEKAESCPFWVPVHEIDKDFRAEFKRKIKDYYQDYKKKGGKNELA